MKVHRETESNDSHNEQERLRKPDLAITGNLPHNFRASGATLARGSECLPTCASAKLPQEADWPLKTAGKSLNLGNPSGQTILV